MSNIHAASNLFQSPLPAFERSFARAASSRLAAAGSAARSLVSAFRNRLTMPHIERFSDHRLNDIGFERDWDRSIIRKQQ